MHRLLALAVVIGIGFVVAWSGLSFTQGVESATGDAQAWLICDYVRLIVKVGLGGALAVGVWRLVRGRT